MQGGREAILELLQQPEMCAFLSACGLSPEMLERMALAAAAQAARAAQDRSACSQTRLRNGVATAVHLPKHLSSCNGLASGHPASISLSRLRRPKTACRGCLPQSAHRAEWSQSM